MRSQDFDAALRERSMLLSELSDNYIVVVMDKTQQKPQPVVIMQGDLHDCETLALAAQFEIEKRIRRNGIQNTES